MAVSGDKRLRLLDDKPAGQLLVHEIYRSLQGESRFAGLPCVFVRLAVCDARCVWCDTPHAFNEGELMAPRQVLDQVLAFGCPLVEITGGEPLLQPEVFGLMTAFADAGLQLLVETSGAHDVGMVDDRAHIIMDIKCPDSGESTRNRWDNLAALKPSDEIKLVIASRADFDWAVGVIAQHQLEDRPLLFSPAWEAVSPLALSEWLLASGLQARMQLQMHKYIWAPDARGV